MTEWKLALLALAFLLSAPQQWRAWAVVFGASMATFIHQGPLFYALIDAVCFAVLFRAPAWQRGIASLFGLMLCLDLAALIYGPPAHYTFAMTALGWLQWALLLGWAFPVERFRKRAARTPPPEPWSNFDLRNRAV